MHQQANRVDCGVFASAFAVDLAFGNDPETKSYETKNVFDYWKFVSISVYQQKGEVGEDYNI